jgi:phage N-6-adenine-methyltransferase
MTSDELQRALRIQSGTGAGGEFPNPEGPGDEWATPQDLFDALDAEFAFTLDVCALPENAKCESYFTPEEDGLAQEWGGACWMNPPYGHAIAAWLQKARAAAKAGATVVCLVPASTDAAWWWAHCRRGEVRFIRGRLKFGDASTPAPFASAVVVFRPGAQRPSVVWWDAWPGAPVTALKAAA